jgi:DNA repair protein RadC
MEDALLTISEIEIRYNPKIPTLHKPQIKSSNDAFRQFILLLDEHAMNIKEEAAVLFLDRGNRVIGCYKISVGGITGTVVDIRIILGIALKCFATGIILAYTHASGELKPSKADMNLTDQLTLACKTMEITLHDHFIITTESYYNFEDEGLL